jgi:hypothetical protein
MRYIIECDDPTDIIWGMRAIKNTIKHGDNSAVMELKCNSFWYVKKTKTGYLARTARRIGDE